MLADIIMQAAPFLGAALGGIVQAVLINAIAGRYVLGAGHRSLLLAGSTIGILVIALGHLLYTSGVLEILAHLGRAGAILQNLGSDTAAAMAALLLAVTMIFLAPSKVKLLNFNSLNGRLAYIVASPAAGFMLGEISAGASHYISSTLDVFGM